MDEDWGLLATEIKAARIALGMKQKDLAKAAGIGYSSLQRLEGGHRFEAVPPSAYKLAHFFGWTHESPRLILAGGKPVLAEPSDAPKETPRRGLPARVEAALEEGELLDTEVLELPGGLTVVVVARQDEARSAEERAELADALREWTRTQRKLKDIAEEA
ncbi:helix-turn-helix domain-containing protein [Streptomyces sp. NPDC006339]|uniref:helix-turn-helix transcriptional regulator n=1 Tax=Streptomyces sp. NPDC006339 TaxID=3156755 RepID=UPI0033B1A162